MTTASFDPATLDGSTVHGTDGDKIGKVTGVFSDQETGKPEWVSVSTGMFGSKETLIPLAAVTQDGEQLTVPFDKEKVKNAPHNDPADELSQQQEAELFTYYGVPYGGETVTSTGAPQAAGTVPAGDRPSPTAPRAGDDDTRTGQVGHDTSGPNTDDAMTRSEERLRVGTQSVETGRVRLRKHIVSENVSTTVPVSHEEVTIEREPITEENRGAAMAGGELTEEEHEVVLHGEEVVTSKETVPVERVRLGTQTHTEDQQVDETVRKEQIETVGDDGPRVS